MRRTRRRSAGRKSPAAFFARFPTKAELGKRVLENLLIAPSRLFALGRRVQDRLCAMGLCRTCRPQAVTVGVGGMAPESRGRVLLTSWLLGWAKARAVGAAVTTPLSDAHPPVLPYQISPGGDLDAMGIEAALLASYVPQMRCIIDANPVRGAKTAIRTFAPDMLILQDALADPRLKRDIELAMLNADDLGPGWDRVFPAGRWRRDASVLSRVSAFCIFAGPLGLEATMHAAQRRLAHFGKPIFSLTFNIWRWRGPERAARSEDLVGQPYIAVLAESDRELLPEVLRQELHVAPRMVFFVHDHHRFTLQDFENLRADAIRLKAKNILTSPRLALKLSQAGPVLDGHTVWTYDPEVVFGPTLQIDTPFLPWWEAAYAAALGRRTT